MLGVCPQESGYEQLPVQPAAGLRRPKSPKLLGMTLVVTTARACVLCAALRAGRRAGGSGSVRPGLGA